MPTPTIEPARGSRGIFDVILSWASSLQDHGIPRSEVEEFVEWIQRVEREIQDAGSEKVGETAKGRLAYWFSLAEDETNRFDLPAFTANVRTIYDLLQALASMDELEVKRQIESLVPRPPQEWLDNYKLSGAGSILEGFTLRNTVKSLRQFSAAPIPTSPDEWEIKLKIGREELDASEMGFLIWSLAEALELVEGVQVTIEDWGRGSFWIKLKILFLDIAGKREVKEILEKARDAAIAEQLDKRIEETAKLKAERLKIEEERAAIKAHEAVGESPEEAAVRRKLELQKLEIEVASGKLSLQERRFELAKKVAYMVKEGLIFADPVEIEVNGQPFLAIEDGKLRMGSPMQDLEPVKVPPPESSGSGQVIK